MNVYRTILYECSFVFLQYVCVCVRKRVSSFLLSLCMLQKQPHTQTCVCVCVCEYVCVNMCVFFLLCMRVIQFRSLFFSSYSLLCCSYTYAATLAVVVAFLFRFFGLEKPVEQL